MTSSRFHPERMASRILRHGTWWSALVEKAAEAVDMDGRQKAGDKMRRGELPGGIFLEQLPR